MTIQSSDFSKAKKQITPEIAVVINDAFKTLYETVKARKVREFLEGNKNEDGAQKYGEYQRI